jgi:cation:H+ antiporter
MPSLGALFEFRAHPLWVNLAVFAASAGVVWVAGTRLGGYANTIANRTGIGKALVGLVLLGGITSLPEVATSASAAASGNAALAVNNLLGGVALQVAILAAADAAVGRDALSSVVAHPVVLLQGTLKVLLLVIVAAGIVVGDVGVGGVGVWSSMVLVGYLASLGLLHRYERRRPWVPDSQGRGESTRRGATHGRAGEARRSEGRSTAHIAALTAAAALAILAAGFLLTRTGEAVAVQTGLGSSFVGAILVAAATSLPEVSTVLSAVRLREYQMAISSIFGTNLFDIVLVFLADAIYAGPPVLNEVGRFSVFASLLGVAVTTAYVAGLVERLNRTVWRMGVDSLAVLVLYVGGVVVLYSLR